MSTDVCQSTDITARSTSSTALPGLQVYRLYTGLQTLQFYRLYRSTDSTVLQTLQNSTDDCQVYRLYNKFLSLLMQQVSRFKCLSLGDFTEIPFLASIRPHFTMLHEL